MWVHHSDCPYNVKDKKSGISVHDRASHNGDVIYYSENSPSDTESISLKGSVPTPTGDTSWCFEDDIISGNICVCGASTQGLPLEPRHNFKVGDCEFVCMIANWANVTFLVLCKYLVIDAYYFVAREFSAKRQITTVTGDGDVSISVDNWQTAAKTSLRDVAGDSESLEVCNCGLAKPAVEHVVDLTEDPTVVSSANGSAVASNTWVSTPLCSLHVDKKREILSLDGWFSVTVIRAAQLLILQEFPNIAGLQDLAVHRSLSFQILGGECEQVIFIGGCHWCTVSNVGCDDGVVNVYDSMYSSLCHSVCVRHLQWW